MIIKRSAQHTIGFLLIFLSVFALKLLIPDNLLAASALYFPHTNHQGSVIEVTDSQGNPVESERYYAYGEERVSDGETSERKFTGQVKDSEDNLYYYNARYYDGTLSIFISPDQYGGGNRYIYVSGNPVNYVDPTGNYIIDEGDNPTFPLPQSNPSRSPLSTFTGSQWTQAEINTMNAVSLDVGAQMARVINEKNRTIRNLVRHLAKMEDISGLDPSDYANVSAREAFLGVFGGPVEFQKSQGEGICGDNPPCWGVTSHSEALVYVRGDLGKYVIPSNPNFIAHEIGHVFDFTLSEVLLGVTGGSPVGQAIYNAQIAEGSTYPNRVYDDKGNYIKGNYGFATTYYDNGKVVNPFQQSKHPSAWEEGADQFIGWTYNTWQMGDSGELAPEGEARKAFMDHYMPIWIMQIYNSR